MAICGKARAQRRDGDLLICLYDARPAGVIFARCSNDRAYDLVMQVAAGELDQAEEIAAVLQGTTARRQ